MTLMLTTLLLPIRGLGALNVMRNALKDANLKPEDVDYINVHGTATPLAIFRD